jgi:hypothetical protein
MPEIDEAKAVVLRDFDPNAVAEVAAVPDRHLDQAADEVALLVEAAEIAVDVGASLSLLVRELEDLVGQLGPDIARHLVVVLAADGAGKTGGAQAAAVDSPRSGR